MESQPRPLERLDAPAARRWVVAARAALAAHRAEIDALNVFPVPDGDTGTNLYLTLDNALDRVRLHGDPPDLTTAAAELSRATLLAARGNSGVILSQLVRGIAEVVASAGAQEEGVDGPTLSRALRRASDLARASVTRPVEGTILTVAAAAAAAAEETSELSDAALYAVATAALDAARTSLADTPLRLPALAEAGVVDAGGAGYVLVLEALHRVVRGDFGHGPAGADPRAERPDWKPGPHPRGPGREPRSPADGLGAGQGLAGQSVVHAGHVHHAGAGHDAEHRGHGSGGGPAYEVMYLLAGASVVQVEVLRTRLDSLGDSVLVVGEAGLWNVHAHVDDVGAAIEAGLQAGRPHRIAVTHFGDQRLGRSRAARPAVGVAVVACAAGEGLADLFRQGGATVVDSAPGRRASTGSLLRAIEQAGAATVLVLPNDLDTRLAAEAAATVAAEDGIHVSVLRAVAAVQGIAALAVYDPLADPVASALAMNQAADATRHGSVTVASRAARTPAGPCRPGDVLGIIDGDVAIVGTDLALVAAQVLRAMLRQGGELVTLVTGLEAPPDLGETVASELPDVEVTAVVGGQPTYPLLIGVE